MASLLRFVQLPTKEKGLILKSLFLATVIRVLLWLLPVRFLQRLFMCTTGENPDGSESDWDEITRIVHSIRSVSRFVPQATCLTQALAASLLIRFSGQDSELKIGVAKDDSSRLIAHAWLEKDGQIILGELPDQGRFVPLRADSVLSP